jgi:hypothetical protein
MQDLVAILGQQCGDESRKPLTFVFSLAELPGVGRVERDP